MGNKQNFYNNYCQRSTEKRTQKVKDIVLKITRFSKTKTKHREPKKTKQKIAEEVIFEKET